MQIANLLSIPEDWLLLYTLSYLTVTEEADFLKNLLLLFS